MKDENRRLKALRLAIMNKCLDCSVYDRSEVKLCPDTKCPLWPYRNSTSSKTRYEEVPKDADHI